MCALLAAIVFAVAVLYQYQVKEIRDNPVVAEISAITTDTDENGVQHFLVSGRVMNRSEQIYGVPSLVIVSYDTKGNVISVFGCGGDRDTRKRPVMGEISGRIANYTIITSDNPRTEDPQTIVDQIEEGIKKTKGKYEVIVDRTEAIEKAIKMAHKNDIIVLAGKGHEPYQEINGVKNPFDERIIVNEIIQKIKKKG